MPARHLALLGGTTTFRDCLEALKLLARPSRLVKGPVNESYEREFAGRTGTRHAISFSSGRVGLYALLKTLGIGDGDQVLLQVPTHIVVANAIRYLGARPLYVDCREDGYNIDLEHAERLTIGARAKVLLVQHTYGIPVDMQEANAFARKHNLHIIEDCVHSLGATQRGQQTGSFGRAAFFSTEETKMISTSLGGIVVCNEDDLASSLRVFRDAQCAWPGTWLAAQYLLKFIAYQLLTQPNVHRISRAMYDMLGRFQPLPKPVSKLEWVGDRPPNYLQRLSDGQALMGLRQLHRLDENLAHRRAIADIYLARLGDYAIDALRSTPPDSNPSWCRFPVRVKDRHRIERRLRRYAVPGIWFSSVLEESSSPKFGDYEPGSCPNAEAIVGHVINLPTHGRVLPEDAERLANALLHAIEEDL